MIALVVIVVVVVVAVVVVVIVVVPKEVYRTKKLELKVFFTISPSLLFSAMLL